MRVGRWLSAILLVSLFFPAVTSAQQPMGSIFFTDERLETSGFADCRDAHMHGMSKETPEDGEVQVGISYGALGCRLKFQYAVEEDFQLAGDVAFIGFFGCEIQTVASPTGNDFRFHLFKNGEEISQKATEYGNCNGDFELTETVSSADTVFAPGDTLGFEIVVWYLNPDEAATDNLHLKVGASNPSRIEAAGLPIAGGAPVSDGARQVHQNLTAPAFEHTFENATSDTYILNLTSELENATASFAWNATAGSVNATLRDGNGTTVFAGRFEGNGTQNETLADVVAGAWNLTLEYSNFTGSLSFSLDAPGGGGGEQDEGGFADGNGTADGNATLDGGGDQESPGLPLLVAASALVAVARLRRR